MRKPEVIIADVFSGAGGLKIRGEHKERKCDRRTEKTNRKGKEKFKYRGLNKYEMGKDKETMGREE
jgi:hypothetical protein